jgi:hypothetical protein
LDTIRKSVILAVDSAAHLEGVLLMALTEFCAEALPVPAP